MNEKDFRTIMIFGGIEYNKKEVKMSKKVFLCLINTLLLEWDSLSDKAKKQYTSGFAKIMRGECGDRD